MRVLVACEFSGIVRDAFAAKGHEAWSCDLLPTERPGKHIQGNVVHEMYREDWDLIIAHPPCTRLCKSGVRWLGERDLWQEMYFACELFNMFQSRGKDGTKVCIENPIPHKYAVEYIGRYHQIIHPWQFGHGEKKPTCLWLYNLPKLKHFSSMDLFNDVVTHVNGRSDRIHRIGPGPNRGKERSITYEGIAKAMAEQWS